MRSCFDVAGTFDWVFDLASIRIEHDPGAFDPDDRDRTVILYDVERRGRFHQFPHRLTHLISVAIPGRSAAPACLAT
jgi:hypothetical protein